MSDTSAGPPAAEPTGSPSVPASTDPASSDAAPHEPQSNGSASTGSPTGDAPTGDAPSSDSPSPPSSTGASRNRRRRKPAGAAEDAGGKAGADEDAGGEAGADEDAGGEAGAAPADVAAVGAVAGATATIAEVVPTAAPSPRLGDTRPPPARPRIGDTRPARVPATPAPAAAVAPASPATRAPRGAKRPAPASSVVAAPAPGGGDADDDTGEGSPAGGRSRRKSGRERRGRPVGRYLMCVHVRPHATQIAVLEGRTLVEHYVSRISDDATQIDGNIYRGRVQNVLPGMEAAFIDIGTPKNAVLYRGDVRYDRDDIETAQKSSPRIEEMLRPGQVILCQVTKNPIGAKGARLTQEVSLPGRFVVMVPNSTAFGISKRLDDNERKRLRRIVDEVRPPGHGLIVRTAAEGASQEELRHDVDRLVSQWAVIEAEAGRSSAPGLLYREPDLAVRIVREEFNREYRGVVIDDEELFAQVRDYIGQVNPELADRVEYYDPQAENLPVFERFHVHEQLHKALDRKVWLTSGGSIIIERTEALTVIDVNTGKNVGTSNLEETVYRNNLEAAEEIARQLRLRDIGGIIVIDFIDMEIRENRDRVAAALRSALARDKTRTQVFDISELGLVEMTRKRVSEGLVESLSSTCTICGGRGIVLDDTLL
ncbi:MAG TPA: Rne/Rng family ribonuclease [Acidimicrobiales bacterium]|nr:Rne/Rng family ribonuclease [Acidimicrobiales bacterium]